MAGRAPQLRRKIKLGKLAADRLLFELRWERDGYSVRSGRKKGRPDPEWVQQEPKLPAGGDLFTKAYSDLCSERLYERGAIPFSKVMIYAQHHGLEPDVAELLWDVVRAMDLAEASWVAETVGASEDGKQI